MPNFPFINTVKHPASLSSESRNQSLAATDGEIFIVDSSVASRHRPTTLIAEIYAVGKNVPIANGVNVMGGVPVVSVYVRPIRLHHTGNLELLSLIEIMIATELDNEFTVHISP